MRMTIRRIPFWVAILLSAIVGLWLGLLGRPVPVLEGPRYRTVAHHAVRGFPRRLAQYEGVFWEPRDTSMLRRLIGKGDVFEDKTVLEIGAGTGLLSLCCLQAGARRVIATDINPAAVANTRYNADLLGYGKRLAVRRVSRRRPGAFSVVKPTEKFHYIISNPPWEDRKPRTIEEYALCDDNFDLLRSILAGLKTHLEPGGRAYLVYGCVEAVEYVQRLAPRHDLHVRLLDNRRLDELPEVFLPGMLIEVTPEPSMPGTTN